MASMARPSTWSSRRFVTVWLTSLPPVEDGFRGSIAEVAVKG